MKQFWHIVWRMIRQKQHYHQLWWPWLILPLVGGLCHEQWTSTIWRPQVIAPCLRPLSCTVDFKHDGSQWSAPCWRTLSCTTDADHKGPQRSAPCLRTLSHTIGFDHNGPQRSTSCWRTLSCSTNFYHNRSQGSAPCWRSLSPTMDFDHKGPQRSPPSWRTLSHTKDFDHNEPQETSPHWRILSRTRDLTTVGKDLPLVGGVCLVQQTLTILANNDTDEPQQQMTCSLYNKGWKCRGSIIKNSWQTIEWDNHKVASYYLPWRFCLEWMLVGCYDGVARVSLSEEAQTKSYGGRQCQGWLCHQSLLASQSQRILSEQVDHARNPLWS